MKKFVIKLATTFGIGLVLSLLFCLIRGAFSAENTSDTYKYLCDGFFVAAVLFLGFGILIICSNSGTFDMLAFGTKKFFGSIFSSRKSLEEKSKKTFADYREERTGNRKPFLHLIFSGTLLLIIAIIFLILYMNATP